MYKVFIVEDELIFLQELLFSVEWERWDFLVCGSARDAREAAAGIVSKKPDLVISDIRMPGMDGLELAESINSQLGSSAPEFIIISGYDDFEYARSALRLGISNYLLKPLDDEELHGAILRVRESILGKQARRRLEETIHSGHHSTLMLFKEYALDRQEDQQARYVAAAITHIQECYQRELSVEDAAARLGLSAGYLSRIFKQKSGYTFTDYLLYYRIKRAVELLKDNSYKIYEIADLVGYTDQRYFSQVFRRLVGLTPSSFRGQQKGHQAKESDQEAVHPDGLEDAAIQPK